MLADWGRAVLDDLKDFVLSAHIEVIDLDDVFESSIGLENEFDEEFAVRFVVVLHVFPSCARLFEDGDIIGYLLLDEIGDGVIVIDLVSELLQAEVEKEPRESAVCVLVRVNAHEVEEEDGGEEEFVDLFIFRAHVELIDKGIEQLVGFLWGGRGEDAVELAILFGFHDVVLLFLKMSA